MARLEFKPDLARHFLEALYGPYYSQATRLSYLEIRSRKETDPIGRMPFNRFYPGIDPLLKGMGKWERGRNYWIGVALRKSNKSGKKVDCLALTALYADVDYGQDGHRKKSKWQTRGEALAAIHAFPLRPSILVHSGGGFQAYWLLNTPVSLENGNYDQVEAIMKGLNLALGGDVGTQDVSRILRLPGTYNMKLTGNPRPAEIEWCEPERLYVLADFTGYEAHAGTRTGKEKERGEASKGPQPPEINALSVPAWTKTLILSGATEGYPSRSERDHAVIGELVRAGFTLEPIAAIFQAHPVGEKYREKGSQGRVYLQVSINKIKTTLAPQPIPSQLAEAAYYGLAGEFVRLIEPHTEADPVALLAQFLTAFGNVIGRGAFFQVEADTHYLKLFTVLVGQTSKARKGTAWGHIHKIFQETESSWTERVMSGLSSGEGLIWQVRDAITKKGLLIEPGVEDKRLLAMESEFAGILRNMGREGNILSVIIRQAWDKGDLRTLTKNTPAVSTGAHISIIGHVTKDELQRYLDRTEAANGFGNRFIWLFVERSKCLPEGGNFNQADLGPIILKLKVVIDFSKGAGEVKRDEPARKIWAEIYPQLSEGKPGLAGALTSRGEAQVMRLAGLYALLDQSLLIKPVHLHAALALWDYAEASVRYIFGNAIGDPIADQILAALKNSQKGFTRTEISNLFGRNIKADRLQKALTSLQIHGLALVEALETDGRKAEIWKAVTK